MTALKLVEFDPKTPNKDFRCGNNNFSDDVWDFKGYIEQPTWNDKKFQLDFTVFPSEPIRYVVKQYAASDLLINNFNSVKRKLSAFKQFRDFSLEQSIDSFTELNPAVVRNYFEYCITATNKEGVLLSAVSRKMAAQVFQELLIRGSVKGWNVPKDTQYVKSLYQMIIIENKGIKNDTKFGKTNKVLPSPAIVDQLLKVSQQSLDKDEDVLTAASIILTTQIGCRISEILSIKTGCIKVLNGETHIVYTTSKTDKTPIEVVMPANELVVKTIDKLESYSAPLRVKSGLPNLFLTVNRNRKGYPIVLASYSNWGKNRLRPFLQKHNICDESGMPVELTHHTFRHIFATTALKSGMKIHDVAEMMNHKSLAMTLTYDHSDGDKQDVVKEILSGQVPVSTTNKVVLNSIEGVENPFKGLTTDQVDKMRRALKIELLPHGMCLHHPMRGEPCAQDGVCLGCNNFLASAKHLPIYEKRLDKVNQELSSEQNGDGIFTTKLQYQKGKLQQYVNDLRAKMDDSNFKQEMAEMAVTKDE